VNWRTIADASGCTKAKMGFAMKKMVSLALLIFIGIPQVAAAWKVDLSRRQQEMRERDLRRPSSEMQRPSMLDMAFHGGEPQQELVILNTDQGFVPSRIQVRRGGRYRVHVVNVNSKAKNVSFIMDAFSEHHSTYFGHIASFNLEPKKEGVYSFQCPETASEGRLVVLESVLSERIPANIREK
jgi:hypothetical protein